MKYGELYPVEIAIDESLMQGIGRKVVFDTIEYAKSKTYKRIILDADFRNKCAKSLYKN